MTSLQYNLYLHLVSHNTLISASTLAMNPVNLLVSLLIVPHRLDREEAKRVVP